MLSFGQVYKYTSFVFSDWPRSLVNMSEPHNFYAVISNTLMQNMMLSSTSQGARTKVKVNVEYEVVYIFEVQEMIQPHNLPDSMTVKRKHVL